MAPLDKSLRALALCALLSACGTPPSPPADDLDATTFRAMLKTKESSRRIEKIKIYPREQGTARYEITFADRQQRSSASTEFSNTVIDEIVAAGVPYMVGNIDDRAERMKVIDMTILRAAIASGEIESIRIEQLEQRARYIVRFKTGTVTNIAYGEYPGRLVDAIERAKIPYTIDK